MLLIFVALGTDEHPFRRAIEIVAPLAEEHELLVQHGHTPPTGIPRARWLEFMPYDDVVAVMREASAVVCHSGVGTIMTALGCGKRPLVLVREQRHGEHVDDHQRQVAKALSDRGLVLTIASTEELRAALEHSTSVVWDPGTRRDDLRRAVAAAVAGE
jgi:UDP-N-acetylglucosamine transferase subunit ALG13